MSTAKTPQQLIDEHQGLVKSLALQIHRQTPPHVELDDLLGYGQVGLAEAARDFDPRRGGRFSTYAYYRIRGAIYDGLAKMTWTSRSQLQRIRYERRANDVLQTARDEAANATDGSAAGHATWFRDVTDQLFVTTVALFGAAGAEPDEMAIPDRQPPPADVAAAHEIRATLEQLIDQLAPEAKALIRAAYYEDVTLQEAGKRLGLSKSWASRLHARALRQLACGLRRAGMDPSVLQ